MDLGDVINKTDEMFHEDISEMDSKYWLLQPARGLMTAGFYNRRPTHKHKSKCLKYLRKQK